MKTANDFLDINYFQGMSDVQVAVRKAIDWRHSEANIEEFNEGHEVMTVLIFAMKNYGFSDEDILYFAEQYYYDDLDFYHDEFEDYMCELLDYVIVRKNRECAGVS